MSVQIIHPLNNLYKVIDNIIKIYSNKDVDYENIYNLLLSAIQTLHDFRADQKRLAYSWSNIYHKREYIDNIVNLKDYYNNMLILLNSFSEKLILIQSDKENVGMMCPTLHQFEVMLREEYSELKSPIIFYDRVISSIDKQEIIVVGDIGMLMVWKDVSNKKYNEHFLRYLNRYKGLLKNYITNENKDKITERLNNSVYTERNGFTNSELLNLINQYDSL